MSIRLALVIFTGSLVVVGSGYAIAARSASDLVAPLEAAAADAIAEAGGQGVTARFANNSGSASRHPVLFGGGPLDEATRARVAKAVAAIPGVGGVVWSDGTVRAQANVPIYEPLHCQEDVEGLLRSRTIRFEEASSALLPASRVLLDEVADALRPCLGSIIAITGHTDRSGSEPGNILLSMDRARAVREALVRRGIPRDGLRARGVGSREPAEGLPPTDPANRRIEFSVVRTVPLLPTPIDTPGAR